MSRFLRQIDFSFRYVILIMALWLLLAGCISTGPVRKAYEQYPIPHLDVEEVIYKAQQTAESFTQKDLHEIRRFQHEISTFLWNDPITEVLAIDRDGLGSNTPRIIYTGDLNPKLCAVLLGPSRGNRDYPSSMEIAKRLYGPRPEKGIKHVMGVGSAGQQKWRENQTTRQAYDNWRHLTWRVVEIWDRKSTLCQMAVDGWWTGKRESNIHP
jgi:hypothetical protein